MPLFLAAIFLSAFLLFQVQPVIARFILPWYGGSPAVWTTCLLFFQTGLLLGYAYAHALVNLFRNRPVIQIGVHFSLLFLAAYLLPITPTMAEGSSGAESSPVLEILQLLATSVGFPYLLLSASGPLFQHWFSETYPDRSPYRLYAISNLGSLLGLLSYPFLIEPALGVKTQTLVWSFGFVVFAFLAVATGFRFFRSNPETEVKDSSEDSATAKLRIRDVALWIAFAATGSLLLLSLTNQICQDVAVVPFFWVIPLSLYLLTFVISFDHARWYKRTVWIPLALVAIGGVVYLINQQFETGEMHFAWQLVLYLAAIFCGCFVAHGEMVRRKPPVRHLTAFYLAISFGGALGGLFVSVIAPLVFIGYWELHLSFVSLFLLAAVVVLRGFWTRPERPHFLKTAGASLVLLIALITGLIAHVLTTSDDSLTARRGFYGVLRVYEEGEYPDQYRSLYHGRISHGMQFTDPTFEDLPTTYYTKDSGIGIAFNYHKGRSEERTDSLRVGAIGLGVGTVMTYSKPGDDFRFYEINPQVEELARSQFTFLENGKGDETVVLGDARISLQKEWEESGSRELDILVVDAFSGDSIPLHLLTREAFELYLKHLKPDGILAVHISNLHLDLSIPVRTLAKELSLDAIPIEHDPSDDDYIAYYSDWVLLTRELELRIRIETAGYDTLWYADEPDPILWTDDYSNLLDVIDW